MFVLTAKLNIVGPKNMKSVISNIRRQLSNVTATVNVQVKPINVQSVTALNTQLNKTTTAAKKATKAADTFGKQSALAFKRFFAFTVATTAFIKLVSSMQEGVKEAIAFQHEMVKISQVTGKTVSGLKGLSSEITRLSTNLGVSSMELLRASRTLAQAGLSASDTTKALDALAKTTLTPSFNDLTNTTEGAIAVIRQFGIEAQDLGKVFGSINKVAAGFAVEAEDITAAVRRAGGAFASAGGNLNEFIALFTSVRATTRESAETIATGFRTIFTRLQRVRTINFLKNLGIDLQDAEGQFIGPFKAVEKLSQAMSQIRGTDPRFSQIIEELGGFRQVSKVIPLIQQFGTAQKALGVALAGQGSLAKDAVTAQESLATQFTKVREEFVGMIRAFSENKTLRALVDVVLNLATAFIKVGKSLEPLTPLLLLFGASVAPRSIKKFGSNFLGGLGVKGFARGGMVPGVGNSDTVPAMLQPGEFVLRKQVVNKVGANNLEKVNQYASGGVVRKGRGGYGQKSGKLTAAEYDKLQSLQQQKSLNDVQQISLDSLSGRYKQYGSELDDYTKVASVGVMPPGFRDVSRVKLGKENFLVYRSALNKEDNRDVQHGVRKGLYNTVSGIGMKLSSKLGIPFNKNNIKTFLKSTDITSAEGVLTEAVIGTLTDIYQPKPEKLKSIDFPSGFDTKLASYFNIPERILTDVTRNAKDSKSAKIVAEAAQSYLRNTIPIQKMASGGIVRGGLLRLPPKPAEGMLPRELGEEGSGDIRRARKRRTDSKGNLLPQARFATISRNARNARRVWGEVPYQNLRDIAAFKKFDVGSGKINTFTLEALFKNRAYLDAIANMIPAGSKLLGSGTEAVVFGDGRFAYRIAEKGVRGFSGNRPKSKNVLQALGSKTFGNLIFEKMPMVPTLDKEINARAGIGTEKAAKLRERVEERVFNRLYKEFGEGVSGNEVQAFNMGLFGGRIKMVDPNFMKFAKGGSVGTDTVPALLTPGEFVINRDAVKKIGVNNLKAVNKYASGGVVRGSRQNYGPMSGGGAMEKLGGLFFLTSIMDMLGEKFGEFATVLTSGITQFYILKTVVGQGSDLFGGFTKKLKDNVEVIQKNNQVRVVENKVNKASAPIVTAQQARQGAIDELGTSANLLSPGARRQFITARMAQNTSRQTPDLSNPIPGAGVKSSINQQISDLNTQIKQRENVHQKIAILNIQEQKFVEAIGEGSDAIKVAGKNAAKASRQFKVARDNQRKLQSALVKAQNQMYESGTGILTMSEDEYEKFAEDRRKTASRKPMSDDAKRKLAADEWMEREIRKDQGRSALQGMASTQQVAERKFYANRRLQEKQRARLPKLQAGLSQIRALQESVPISDDFTGSLYGQRNELLSQRQAIRNQRKKRVSSFERARYRFSRFTNRISGGAVNLSNGFNRFRDYAQTDAGRERIGNIGTGLASTGLIGGGLLSSAANKRIQSGKGGTGLAAAGGALSGASTGALVGSMFGPVGIAVGALGGAAIGAGKALIDTQNQIQQISFSKSLGDLNKMFEDVAAGKTSASLQRGRAGIAARAQLNVLGQSGGIFGNRDELLKEASASADQVRNFALSLVDGKQTFDQFVQSNKDLLSYYDLISDEALTDLHKSIKDQISATQTQTKLTENLATVQDRFAKMLRNSINTIAAFEQVGFEMSKFGGIVAQITAGGLSQAQDVGLGSMLSNIQSFGGTRGFESAITRRYGSDDMAQEVIAVGKVMQKLPEALLTARATGGLTGDTIEPKIDAFLSSFEDVPASIRTALDKVIREQVLTETGDTSKFLADFESDPQATIEKFKAGLNIAVDALAKRNEIETNFNNQIGAQYQDRLKLIEQEQGLINRGIDIRQQGVELIAQARGREVDPRALMSLENQRRQAVGLQSPTGMNTSVKALGDTLRYSTAQTLDFTHQIQEGAQNVGELQSKLHAMQIVTQKTKAGLEFLSDASSRAAPVLAAISKERAKADFKFGLMTDVAGAGSLEELQNVSDRMRDLLTLSATGNINTIDPRRRKDVLSGLAGMGDMELEAFGGKKASDILEQTIFNSTKQLFGGRISDKEARMIAKKETASMAGEQGKLDKIISEAVSANNELRSSVSDSINSLSSIIAQQNNNFLMNLQKIMNEREVGRLQGEMQTTMKTIGDLQQKIGAVRNIRGILGGQVDDESIKQLSINGRLSEIQQLRSQQVAFTGLNNFQKLLENANSGFGFNRENKLGLSTKQTGLTTMSQDDIKQILSLAQQQGVSAKDISILNKRLNQEGASLSTVDKFIKERIQTVGDQSGALENVRLSTGLSRQQFSNINNQNISNLQRSAGLIGGANVSQLSSQYQQAVQQQQQLQINMNDMRQAGDVIASRIQNVIPSQINMNANLNHVVNIQGANNVMQEMAANMSQLVMQTAQQMVRTEMDRWQRRNYPGA